MALGQAEDVDGQGVEVVAVLEEQRAGHGPEVKLAGGVDVPGALPVPVPDLEVDHSHIGVGTRVPVGLLELDLGHGVAPGHQVVPKLLHHDVVAPTVHWVDDQDIGARHEVPGEHQHVDYDPHPERDNKQTKYVFFHVGMADLCDFLTVLATLIDRIHLRGLIGLTTYVFF